MVLATTLMEYPSVEHCIGGVTHFEDTPQWIYNLDNPYLHGEYAPTLNEMSVDALDVEVSASFCSPAAEVLCCRHRLTRSGWPTNRRSRGSS